MRLVTELRAKPARGLAIGVGMCALALPFIYTAFVFEPSGELGALNIIFGAVATVFQVAIWSGLMWTMRDRDSMLVALAFAIGTWVSLLAAWFVFTQSEQVLVSLALYIVLAVTTALATEVFGSTLRSRDDDQHDDRGSTSP